MPEFEISPDAKPVSLFHKTVGYTAAVLSATFVASAVYLWSNREFTTAAACGAIAWLLGSVAKDWIRGKPNGD